jgi:hypothetical protein
MLPLEDESREFSEDHAPDRPRVGAGIGDELLVDAGFAKRLGPCFHARILNRSIAVAASDRVCRRHPIAVKGNIRGFGSLQAKRDGAVGVHFGRNEAIRTGSLSESNRSLASGPRHRYGFGVS